MQISYCELFGNVLKTPRLLVLYLLLQSKMSSLAVSANHAIRMNDVTSDATYHSATRSVKLALWYFPLDLGFY